MKLPVIFLMGPTASGKTALAIALCERLPLEIVSVDSAMVYCGMDIGTAKPDATTLRAAPHRLIDIRDPAEVYSVADFCEDARREIDAIHKQGRVPLLVGGSMMYFKSLLNGLADMPPANAEIRAAIEAEAKAHGWPTMHRQLMTVDPESARQLHPRNSQRITRALEVYRQSGKAMTYWRQKQNPDQQLDNYFKVIQLALFPECRRQLHCKIGQRFQQMLNRGFIDEVRELRQRSDIHLELPSMRCVGYRQVWQYLDDLEGQAPAVTEAHLFERAAAATRQLAKRQITWLKTWEVNQKISSDLGHCEKNIEKTLKFLTSESIIIKQVVKH
jgi:tRNA dimethylallyltransferase